jgi:uncharacterized protein YegJ (DUF2314 family)
MKAIWPALALIAGIVCLGAVIGQLSCAQPDEKLVRPNVAETKANPELYVAVQKARHSLDSFIAQYEHPKPGNADFGLQGAFQTPRGEEHLWIRVDNYAKGTFSGHLVDEPVALVGKHRGDIVTIDRNDVTDWIYRSNGKKVGGFTMDVLEKQNAAGSR